MVDRLRALLDRPLDPSAARSILVCASAILIGLAALFVLAAGEPDSPPSALPAPIEDRGDPPPPTAAGRVEDASGGRRSQLRQDPQDVPGSTAARRAARALRSHRALQHVPYRNGRVAIELVGARGSRAVLRVSSATAEAARREWRRFLDRYRDSGRSYLAVFASRGGPGDG